MNSSSPVTAEDLTAVVTSRRHIYVQTAYRIVKNRDDAEDAVQDAMLNAFQKLSSFRGESRLSTWVHMIVVNSALMHLRRRWPMLQPFVWEDDGIAVHDEIRDPAPDPESQIIGRLMLAETMRQIDNLSPVLRETVLLRLQGYMQEEIAKTLGCPLGTIKARTARARVRLRRRLA